MKKYIVLYIWFVTYLPHQSKTMDTTPRKNNKQSIIKKKDSLKELVALINAQIITQYSSIGYESTAYGSFFLPEKHKINILETIAKNSSDDSLSAVLAQLYYKNLLVETSIKHFIDCAIKEIDTVTCYTLNIIENPLLNNTASPLNKLPVLVKSFILENAYNHIEHSYTISIKHEKPISCFDICDNTPIAATATTNIYLWDTTTWQQKQLVPCNPLKQILFNTDGSYLIALEEAHNNTYSLYALDTQQTTLLWAIQFAGTPYHMLFAQGKSDNTLALISKKPNSTAYQQSLWKTNSTQPKKRARLQLPPSLQNTTSQEKPNKIIKENYCARYSPAPTNNTKLLITKKNCHALYLCQQAIKNSSSKDNVYAIKQSQSYQQLTPFEKQIVEKQLSKKEQL